MCESKRTVDASYLNLARTWAIDRSKAVRKKVGAILVSENGQIISDGYNGTPHGFDNRCEIVDEDGVPVLGDNGEMITNPETLHAESNVILKLAANGGPGSSGATMYQTLSPCYECAKLLIQAKIKRVVFLEQYRDTSGIDLLKKAGIEIEQLDLDEK